MAFFVAGGFANIAPLGIKVFLSEIASVLIRSRVLKYDIRFVMHNIRVEFLCFCSQCFFFISSNHVFRKCVALIAQEGKMSK